MASPASPSPEPPQRTSRAIHAYARDARLALVLQVVVAVVALAATVVFAVMIRNATNQLDTVRRELVAESTRLEAARTRVAFADDATRAVLEAAAALATREPARYAAAIASLDAVRANLVSASAELDERNDTAAVRQLKDVRVAVTGTLARVLFARPDRKAEDIERAVALASDNLREPGLTPDQVFAGTVTLATFHCERRDDQALKALVNARFVADFPQIGANGVLPEACRTLAGVAAPPVAAFDASRAEAAYRVRTVYLHVASDTDRPWAAALALALCEAGYDAPGIETVDARKIQPGGHLVYYYEPQASEAAWLAARVGAPWKQAPAIRRLTGFGNLDRHTVELWLPAVGRDAAAPTGADELRRFKGCLAKGRDSGTAETLVAQLVSDNRQDRLSAGQSLANRIRGTDDAEVVAALLAQLEGQKLDHLSAAGRLNVLYLLNVEPAWAGRQDKGRLAAALDTIEARARTRGIAVGSQTGDCIGKLRLKIEGRTAADRCGGL